MRRDDDHLLVEQLVEAEHKTHELEAEILRLRTTEAAAAHALDTIRQLLGLDLVPGEHPSVTRQRIEATLRTVQAERDAYREALTPSSKTLPAYAPYLPYEEYENASTCHERTVPVDVLVTIMGAIRKRAESTPATPQDTKEAP